MSLNTLASPGPELRFVGHTTNGEASRDGSLLAQATSYIEFSQNTQLGDSFSMVTRGAIPFDLQFEKRKTQVYATGKIPSKTRSYYECNSGIAGVLSRLMSKLEDMLEPTPVTHSKIVKQLKAYHELLLQGVWSLATPC
eukprot:3567772-Amphidinium_carterae.1